MIVALDPGDGLENRVGAFHHPSRKTVTAPEEDQRGVVMAPKLRLGLGETEDRDVGRMPCGGCPDPWRSARLIRN